MSHEINPVEMSPDTLRALFDGASDFIFVVDAEHRIVFLNRAFAPNTIADVLGQKVETFAAPSDRERVSAAIDKAFRDRVTCSYEFTSLQIEAPRHFHVRVGPVPSGCPPEVVSLIATDITETKRAERALVDEERFLDALSTINQIVAESTDLEALLANTLDAMRSIFSCDRVWLLSPCDPHAPTFTRHVDRTRPESPMAASNYSRFVFETVLADPSAHDFAVGDDGFPELPEVLSALGIRSQRMMAIRPQGTQPWCLGLDSYDEHRQRPWERSLFEAIGRRLSDAVTSLMLLNDLRQSRQTFRTLVDHSPEAIAILDVDTSKYVLANSKALTLFGRDERSLLSTELDHLSPEHQSSGQRSKVVVQQHIKAALEGLTPVFDWEHLDNGGNLIDCEVRLTRLPADSPQIRWSIRDMRAQRAAAEEQAQLQEQLVQAQKMEAIGQLTGGIAHDFNNLLTVIVASIDVVAADLEHDPVATELLEDATGAARSAAALTTRLLALSRKQSLSPKVVVLADLVDGIAEMLRRALGEVVQIEVVHTVDKWQCEIDVSQLENAILNLAINARDAMPDGGRLLIEIDNITLDAELAHQEEIATGDYVRLSMTDTGAGVPKEVLARVFEPFFTTKGPGRGSGLGLSMVARFVKQSGGHIRLTSTVGVGTTVAIYLPRSQALALGRFSQPMGHTSPQGNGELILVVENDSAVRSLAVRLLLGLGYRTVAVPDAQTALAVLQAPRPVDLLFTDVVLPGGLDGAGLARAAWAIHPDLRVLFTSGFAATALANDGRLGSSTDLIEKPYSRAKLANHVYAALQASRRRAG